jgi:hypothetical protein
MIRQTSAEAYEKIKSGHMINGLKFIVYETLYQHGPLTQKEVYERINQSGKSHQMRAITPRFSELESAGLVFADGTTRKKDAGTRMNNLLWDVTANLPRPVQKRLTASEKLKAAEERIAKLEAYIANNRANDLKPQVQQVFPHMETSILQRRIQRIRTEASKMYVAFMKYIEGSVRDDAATRKEALAAFEKALKAVKSDI